MARSISDQLKAAIRKSENSRYAICQATGVDEAALSRFLNEERGLSLATVDKLADFLNLELVERKRKG
ncbi:helix-turn-helix domain-containing protein [Bythopirellula polymerisocia]|uniref:HTH cro/C1-type domain-containing protein n=1 Tax=Bythopirellula polymerisocia TaxID=2528003 RepID=A0A5C6C1V8_9BACT|nr:helix-turn-helix transcriptional regulator [Bythopirellula polymerisocia]TWU17621.1 hypothetical protein Pla144_50910 [Bythopirellula polymerisocia]